MGSLNFPHQLFFLAFSGVSHCRIIMPLHRAHNRLVRGSYLNPETFTVHLPSSVLDLCLLFPHFPSYFSTSIFHPQHIPRRDSKRKKNPKRWPSREKVLEISDLWILKEKRNQQDVSSTLFKSYPTTGIWLISNSEKASENTEKRSEHE